MESAINSNFSKAINQEWRLRIFTLFKLRLTFYSISGVKKVVRLYLKNTLLLECPPHMFMKLSRYSASFEKKKKKQNNWITPYTRSSIDVFINAFVATDMLVRSYV